MLNQLRMVTLPIVAGKIDLFAADFKDTQERIIAVNIVEGQNYGAYADVWILSRA